MDIIKIQISTHKCVPLQEAVWVCFEVNRVPFGNSSDKPVESKPKLAKESEDPSEVMVFHGGEKTVEKEGEEEEEDCDFHCIFQRISARNSFI